MTWRWSPENYEASPKTRLIKLASQEPAPPPGQGTWMGQGLPPPSGPQT